MVGKLTVNRGRLGVVIDNEFHDLEPGEKPIEVRDTELRGFTFRLQPTGLGTFYLQYRDAAGKTHRLKIGRLGNIGLPRARAKAKEELARVTLGDNPAEEKREARRCVTLREFLDGEYGEWFAANRKSYGPTMARLYYGFPGLLDKRLADLTAFDFERERLARKKADNPPSGATLNRDAATMRACLGKAVKWGHIAANPMDAVDREKEDRNRKVRALSIEEEKRILDALAKPGVRRRKRLRTMIVLSIDCGIRQGELFGLEWRDVDLENRTLNIRGEGTKSSQSREIPLSGRCVDVLKDWKPEKGTQRLVFPADDGGELNNVHKGWRAVLKKAKVEHCRWHDMRHTFGTRLANGGVPLPTVQRLMGHESITTTQRYLHGTADARAAIEAMERATG